MDSEYGIGILGGFMLYKKFFFISGSFGGQIY